MTTTKRASNYKLPRLGLVPVLLISSATGMFPKSEFVSEQFSSSAVTTSRGDIQKLNWTIEQSITILKEFTQEPDLTEEIWADVPDDYSYPDAGWEWRTVTIEQVETEPPKLGRDHEWESWI